MKPGSAPARQLRGNLAQTTGTMVVAVFTKASAGVAAALAAQRSLTDELGDVFRVRMALHTAEAQLHGSYYVGESLNGTARIRACGHGGQMLVSNATADLLAGRLPDHRRRRRPSPRDDAAARCAAGLPHAAALARRLLDGDPP
jgi:class 3 adenylate cyclase